MNLLLAHVEVDGQQVDVRVRGECITEVAARLTPQTHEDVVDAAGAALVAGLHDHHVHLLAAAAAATSVPCGPPSVRTIETLATALRSAPGQGWVRGVGYDESVAGALDRHVLDRLLPDRPVRVQHRSGALWVLNTRALQLTGLDSCADADVERDGDGGANGRLWRYDARLRERLDDQMPDLDVLVQRMHRFGLTGATDATPDLDTAAVSLLRKQPLDLLLLGASDEIGPRKLLLPDHDLPTLDKLANDIAQIHTRGRPVAVHCVTRAAIVLTVLALDTVGAMIGDRIEHAGVVPPELTPRLAALGVAVVTQPSFLALRGDDYLRDVAADDIPYLYPYASLLAAGVPVAPSSDAPYGHLDPWLTIAAARDRRTAAGAVIASPERVDASTALRGFLSPPLHPGGTPRCVTSGSAADLCLLDAPLHDVLTDPHASRVRLVLQHGQPVFSAT